jgi:hypothetical protein
LTPSGRPIRPPIKYHLDYLLQNKITNENIAFIEIKCITYSMAQIKSFGGYKLSLDKWLTACKLHEVTGIPCHLIVWATDGLFYCDMDNTQRPDIVVFGRTDRNDSQDVEPSVLLKHDRFIEFMNTPESLTYQ